MSYLDFFRENVTDNRTKNKEGFEGVKGTCYNMCPLQEIKMREKERLVHLLEVVGDSHKLVKCFSRSAADTTMAYPHLLRPYWVLKNTVEYLLFDIIKRKDVPVSVIYDFVNDRLRAVRQDMTIQRLAPEECAILLDPMVRFYVYFGYKLCELPTKDFDPTLNQQYLLECLKWYLSSSDMAQMKPHFSEDVTDLISTLDINDKVKLPQDRALMESLYILCNLNDIHPLYRYLALPKKLKSNPKIKMAYKLAISNLNGNYIMVGKLSDKLCPLCYYAFALHLPAIQRRAIEVSSHAYNSKQLRVPIDVLRKWLKVPSKEETRNMCTRYGLQIIEDGVKFNKTDFKSDIPLHAPSKDLLREDSFSLL